MSTTATTQTVTSADGTPIAFDRRGDGPAIVLVGGALSSRAGDPLTAPLAVALADRFTTAHLDRRGRGDSGDTQPYAVEREVEDIGAIVEALGGGAALYGLSSGAVLAIEAARQLKGVTKLAVWEPPLIVDDSRPPLPADYVEQLDALVAEGRRGDAVELFLGAAVGIPPEFVAGMKQSPMWDGMTAVAHTLSYDGRVAREVMAGAPLPAAWAELAIPALVLVGGLSEPFMQNGNRALAQLLPNAELKTIEGQDHAVAPDAIEPYLREFFTA